MKAVIIAFNIILLMTLQSCNFLNSDHEVVVYPALQVSNLGGEAGQELIPLNRTIYKISVYRQDVIYWHPGIDEVPNRLKDCVIKDKNNWHCKYNDDSGDVHRVKGNFRIEPIRLMEDTDIVYIKWWRWWWMKISS